VVLMPARIPPHKPAHGDPGATQRLQMCRLLAAGVDGLGVCALELERDGPSYTVDTLKALHHSHPEAELTFIAGADIASTLASWREPQSVLELAHLAVAARPGTDRTVVLEAVAPLGDPGRVSFLDGPLVEISSSMVRARVATGAPIDRLVGQPLAGYIAEHGLYGARTQAAG
jgi:nicotinate-nucleotide adenylyltransferase